MKTSILFSALLATGLFGANAQAQDASARGNASTSAEAAVQGTAANAASADALARRYADAAGSVDAAAGLVNELRAGTAEQAAMSYAEIDGTLSLASQWVADGKAASLEGAVDAVLDARVEAVDGHPLARDVESRLGGAASTVNDTASRVGGAVRGVAAGAGTSGRLGVDAGTGQGNTRIDAGAAAGGRVGTDRPAAELRGNARIDVGADVRPNLPVVRPLLGN